MDRDRVVMSVVDRSSADLKSTWGIAGGYSLWPVTIKILFVIDGRITLSKFNYEFGLGYVLDTLSAPFSWWVHFEVDIAKRDGDLVDDSRPLKYPNFKFTNDGFDLNGYDQVWFFADNPSQGDGGDGVLDDAIAEFALEDAELKLVAEWMDRGGGVFATGDHGILGASTCSRIPRVRTMRKWTHAQSVPTKGGLTRHETLQPNPGSPDREGDTVLQPVEPVYRLVGRFSPFLQTLRPHPLLCSPQGAINWFPDHMHEGEVIADAAVQLDLPLDIPGYTRPEYPFVVPKVLASALDDIGGGPQRPRPHVIAYGHTTNLYYPEPVISLNLIPGLTASDVTGQFGFFKRFGLVGVYDGDPVDMGRVVVDSTWHHWFSLNLDGIARADTPAPYEKMQAYYRNVGLWLAKPSQRQAMLISGIWGVLTGSAPMEFSTEDSPWQVGERVLATLGLTLSPCLLSELVGPFLDERVLAASAVPNEHPESEPSWSGFHEDLLNRAVLGGIGSALVGLALDHREMRARRQRPRLDSEAIRQRAADGVSRGHALLRKSIDDAAAAIDAVRATLAANATQREIDIRIPIDVRRLRVVAETLQLPDPGDPALIGRQVTLTIRIRLDDDVVAHRTFEDVELPPFEARGGVVDFNCAVGEVEVQTGESLSIEVFVGSWTPVEPNPEDFRFRDTLRGDGSNWIGKSVPSRSQAWRLWYRIEEYRPPS